MAKDLVRAIKGIQGDPNKRIRLVAVETIQNWGRNVTKTVKTSEGGAATSGLKRAGPKVCYD